jgi:hypothetical protein
VPLRAISTTDAFEPLQRFRRHTDSVTIALIGGPIPSADSIGDV